MARAPCQEFLGMFWPSNIWKEFYGKDPPSGSEIVWEGVQSDLSPSEASLLPLVSRPALFRKDVSTLHLAGTSTLEHVASCRQERC